MLGAGRCLHLREQVSTFSTISAPSPPSHPFLSSLFSSPSPSPPPLPTVSPLSFFLPSSCLCLSTHTHLRMWLGCVSSLFLLHELCLRIKNLFLILKFSSPTPHPLPLPFLGSCLFIKFMNIVTYLSQGFSLGYKKKNRKSYYFHRKIIL